VNNKRGAPFFKQQLPIGDIIADVTGYNNVDRTTTINFYDSIYNCQTRFTFPTCALPDFNSTDFKPKGGGGGGMMTKAALGAVVDVRSEYVKNICAAVIVTRSDDEEGNNLFHHVPQYVQKVIDKAVRKDKAAVTIQSLARKRIMYNSFKPKMMRIKIEQTAAKRIQARARGVRIRENLKKPRLHYKASRQIQTQIRMCLARMAVEDMREKREACILLQSQAREKCARAHVSARRKEARAILESKSAHLLQNQVRASLARQQVGEVRAQKKSATLLQSKIRQGQATTIVKRQRGERNAATLIQGRVRVRKAQLKVQVRREFVADLRINSAVALQKTIRFRGAKKRVEGMRVERNSAITVQNHIRRSLARQVRGAKDGWNEGHEERSDDSILLQHNN